MLSEIPLLQKQFQLPLGYAKHKAKLYWDQQLKVHKLFWKTKNLQLAQEVLLYHEYILEELSNPSVYFIVELIGFIS